MKFRIRRGATAPPIPPLHPLKSKVEAAGIKPVVVPQNQPPNAELVTTKYGSLEQFKKVDSTRLPETDFAYSTQAMWLAIVVSFLVLSALIFGIKWIDAWRRGNHEEIVSKVPETEGPYVPIFPTMELQKVVRNFDVQVYSLDLSRETANPKNRPGTRMSMRIFVPPVPEGAETHAEHSLPCVLVPPGGSDVFHGMPLCEIGYLEEFFPYARAGMVVVHFSVDAEMRQLNVEKSDDPYYFAELQEGFPRFVAAEGGCVNARYALELALRHLPMVNPDRIYIAGFASGGTLALQFAQREPRLAGCLAFAPCADLELQLARQQKIYPALEKVEGISAYATTMSPSNKQYVYQCPVFVFHSMQDEVFQFRDSELLCKNLKDQNVNVTFAPLEFGEHRESMLEPGIYRGINWIQDQAKENDDLPQKSLYVDPSSAVGK